MKTMKIYRLPVTPSPTRPWLVLCWLFILLHPGFSQAETVRGLKPANTIAAQNAPAARIALVIGNANYKNAPLRNPINDAYGMSIKLQQLGFQVTYLEDATQAQMLDAIDRFGKSLDKTNDIGLFYYAGHGMQSNGRNYLIPLHAHLKREYELKFAGVDVGRVLETMKAAGNPMNIVILDACRDNPFAHSFRSMQHGLAQMDAPSGTLIAYATSPGEVASDGKGANGIYTSNLLANIADSNITVEQMFKRVRAGVMQESNGQQIPWESSSLVGDFYFNNPNAKTFTAAQPADRITTIEKPQAENSIFGNTEAKPWYKRWYTWAAAAVVTGVIIAACSGGGQGGSAGQGGAGGGCSF